MRRHGRSRWNWRNQSEQLFAEWQFAARALPGMMAIIDARILAHSRDSLLEDAAKCSKRSQIVEKNDVRGVPHVRGNGAAWLAGHNHLEKFRRSSQIGDEFVFGIRRQRICQRQVRRISKDNLVGGRERRFHTGAAKLQVAHCVRRNARSGGAQRDRALEAFARALRWLRSRGVGTGRCADREPATRGNRLRA